MNNIPKINEGGRTEIGSENGQSHRDKSDRRWSDREREGKNTETTRTDGSRSKSMANLTLVCTLGLSELFFVFLCAGITK